MTLIGRMYSVVVHGGGQPQTGGLLFSHTRSKQWLGPHGTDEPNSMYVIDDDGNADDAHLSRDQNSGIWDTERGAAERRRKKNERGGGTPHREIRCFPHTEPQFVLGYAPFGNTTACPTGLKRPTRETKREGWRAGPTSGEYNGSYQQ